MECLLFRVTGRVQGVFYRDSTREVAERLGITGYAKNMPDGSVEVLACGPSATLGELAAWLRIGPRMASVDDVSQSTIDCDAPASFTTV